jgi:hypothetical protein
MGAGHNPCGHEAVPLGRAAVGRPVKVTDGPAATSLRQPVGSRGNAPGTCWDSTARLS